MGEGVSSSLSPGLSGLDRQRLSPALAARRGEGAELPPVWL